MSEPGAEKLNRLSVPERANTQLSANFGITEFPEQSLAQLAL